MVLRRHRRLPPGARRDGVEVLPGLIWPAPEELGAFLAFHRAAGAVPARGVARETGVHRRRHVDRRPDRGPARWQPFLDVAPVAGSMVGPMPYPALNRPSMQCSPRVCRPTGRRTSCRNSVTAPSGPTSATARRFPPSRPPCTSTPSTERQRVGPTETAFANRDVKFAPVIAAFWTTRQTMRRTSPGCGTTAAALQPHSAPGGYINFMDGDDLPRVAENYGAELHAACARSRPNTIRRTSST